MEPWQRDYIERNKARLVDHTICSKVLLDELFGRRLLAKVEYQKLSQILSNDGEINQASVLYDLLVTRVNAYDTLIEVLELTTVNQSAAAQILRDGRGGQDARFQENFL